jgi:membrane-associated protease RseP (regulator of RpoE activity)
MSAAIALAACAGASTAPPTVAPGAVAAEADKQRMLVLESQLQSQLRLHRIAYRLLSASAPLCEAKRAYRPSAVIVNHHSYGDEYQRAATQLWSLGDTLQVVGMDENGPAARAGLLVGDRLLSVGGTQLKPGAESNKQLAALLRDAALQTPENLAIVYVREGEVRSVTLRPEEICDYGAAVLVSDDVNAFADGQNVFVTTGLMRFLTLDEELAVVVSHEMSHNAMGHIKKQKQNATIGAILGAIGDIALGVAGVNTGGLFTDLGADMAKQTFSVEFEIEADYVGLYALARADYPLEVAPQMWRRVAVADPKSIKMSKTHPTTADRFVRLDATIEEIRGKQAAGVPLTPNPRQKPAAS